MSLQDLYETLKGPDGKPQESIPTVVLDIHSEGDVILGLSQPITVSLRVSSSILANASKVFKVMLGPNFLEGQLSRSSGQPKHIALPDDDAYGMLLLVALVHHYEFGLATMAHELLTLAVTADKYACLEVLSLPMEAHLQRHAALHAGQRSFNILSSAKLAMAAYTAGLSAMFAVFTRWLVLDCSVPYTALFDALNMEVTLPISALLGLEEQRVAARDHLMDAITMRTSVTCAHPTCVVRSPSSSFQSSLLARFNVSYWPPRWQEQPLREVLYQLYNYNRFRLATILLADIEVRRCSASPRYKRCAWRPANVPMACA